MWIWHQYAVAIVKFLNDLKTKYICLNLATDCRITLPLCTYNFVLLYNYMFQKCIAFERPLLILKKDMPVELTYTCLYLYFIFYTPIVLLAVLTTLRWTLDLQISSKSPHTLWPQTLWVKCEPDWTKWRYDMLQTEIF